MRDSVAQFAEAVVNLKFDEEPKYQAFMTLFDPLCGPQPHRPILTDGQVKVYPKPYFHNTALDHIPEFHTPIAIISQRAHQRSIFDTV